MSWFFHQVANVLELQLSHQSFQWIPRVDFCRTDTFDLPAVQWTLKGFLQHHSSKAIILWGSAFFHVQISHPYMTTGKPITSTIWSFVGKLMSLLYNMLSTFVTAFLPRSKHLLISWLQSLAAVSFEAQENKVCHCFYFLPIYLNEVIGLNVMIFIFWMLSLKPAFLLSSSPSSTDSLVPLHFLPLEWYDLIWSCWYFSQQSWSELLLHSAQHFIWCTLHIN